MAPGSPWLTAGLLAVSLLLGIAVLEVGVRLLIPVRNVGLSFTVYDPVYGRRLKQDASIRRITPGFTMQLTTNSLGHRGPEPREPLDVPILWTPASPWAECCSPASLLPWIHVSSSDRLQALTHPGSGAPS